jgi:hypothetical protein
MENINISNLDRRSPGQRVGRKRAGWPFIMTDSDTAQDITEAGTVRNYLPDHLHAINLYRAA